MTGRDHPVLQAEGVAKSYGGRKILENVSISLGPGELVCLVGVSGAGKTTLFNILSGLERPDGGRVLLNGRDVTGAPGQVSYMLQRDLLLPHKKVLDNAALPLVIRGMKKREARAEAASYFPRFGLEGTEDKYPAQLSGGMRQRAALLRTFLGSREAALFITHDIDEAILLSDRVCVLSGRPGRVAAELTIRPPRPRDPSFPVSGEFLDYKKRILSLLEA